MPRSLLAALVVALAAIMPAAPGAERPDPDVRPAVLLARRRDGVHRLRLHAGRGGEHVLQLVRHPGGGRLRHHGRRRRAIADRINVPDPDEYLGDNDSAGDMCVAADDKTRVDAGGGPDPAVGFATFRLSRYEVRLEQPNGRAPRAGKRMRVEAVGFTASRGKTLYAHYRRNRRTHKTVKLGRLAGDCGDRTSTLKRALPKGLRPGRSSWSSTPRAAIRRRSRSRRRSCGCARPASRGTRPRPRDR